MQIRTHTRYFIFKISLTRVYCIVDISHKLVCVERKHLSCCGGSGSALVRNHVAKGVIRFVSHCGDHGRLGGVYRLYQPLVIKRHQLLHGASSSCDDYHVVPLLIRKSERVAYLCRSLRPLYGHVGEIYVGVGVSRPHRGDYITSYCAGE